MIYFYVSIMIFVLIIQIVVLLSGVEVSSTGILSWVFTGIILMCGGITTILIKIAQITKGETK